MREKSLQELGLSGISRKEMRERDEQARKQAYQLEVEKRKGILHELFGESLGDAFFDYAVEPRTAGHGSLTGEEMAGRRSYFVATLVDRIYSGSREDLAIALNALLGAIDTKIGAVRNLIHYNGPYAK